MRDEGKDIAASQMEMLLQFIQSGIGYCGCFSGNFHRASVPLAHYLAPSVPQGISSLYAFHSNTAEVKFHKV